MTNDRQSAWDTFMGRLTSVAQDPERVLGSPGRSVPRSGDDLERDWRWNEAEQGNPPWDCSVYDHTDKRARIVRWRIDTRTDVQHLIANFHEDGSVALLVLVYIRASKAGTISVAYEHGRSAPQRISNVPESHGKDLPSASMIEEMLREIPTRLLQ
jgi:hypothetical protein